MTRFMFWNVHGVHTEDVLCRLVTTHQVDILVLAESPEEPADLARMLSLNSPSAFWDCPGTCPRIQVYANFSPDSVVANPEGKHYSIRKVLLPSGVDILLVAVHLGSKLRRKDPTQMMDGRDLAEEIRKAEAEAQHSRTILVGDLNMNPFDAGVVAARALNAVMSAEVARTGSRTLGEKAYPFFYNPMWNKLGDAGGSPPGTYFYPDSNDVCYYWNIVDQVLVRPDLLPYFDPKTLRVLDSDGKDSLLSRRGKFTVPTPSDHLPLLFELAL
jgi:hypothetical protein